MDSTESHSESKYRKNNEKMFGFFYASILLSIGISISVYGTSTAGSSERMMVVKVYYILMYLSSVVIIIGLWVYLFINRNKTYEGLIKGGNDSFKFILSKRGEKVNMYLRFGLAMFGSSSLVFICIATYIRRLDTNSKAGILIHGFCQASFITAQTIFILFYHRLVTLVHKNVMKFALLHLMITNMLMWANASIGKVSSEFETSTPCSNGSNEKICKICVYLLPTVSEYTVIAAAVIYEVYLRIGKYTLIELEKKEPKKAHFSQFSHTLPGLLGGASMVFICMFTSISSIVLYVLMRGHRWIFIVHSTQMIMLNILGIVFLVIAYIKIRKMKFSLSLTKSSLDKNVLFVSYILAINFSILVLVTCGDKLSTNADFGSYLTLRIFSAIFEIIQASIQTHFIIECFQRCSYDNQQKELKPGRNCLSILLGINFGMWFLWTLQIKNADIIYHKDKKQYSFISNNAEDSFRALLYFFLQSTLPLGMLYRYHSSACLSDIYSKIYQTESERFVDHLRSGKMHQENGILSGDQISSHKNSNKIPHSVAFNNVGYDDNDETDDPMGEKPLKKRSQSAGIIPMSILNKVNKKMIRRATLINMQEAQYKFISEQISHQMLHRKMSPLPIQPKGKKSQKSFGLFQNMNKIIEQSFMLRFDIPDNEDSDKESAYSI